MDRPEAGSASVAEALRILLASVHEVEASLARRLGLGTSDVVALQYLVDNEAAGPVHLARALQIRSASATALVDRLEAAGHLRRAPHPTDGRRVVLALTDSARAEVVSALTPLIEAINSVVAEFDEDDQASIERFLRRATAAMGAFAEQTGPR